MELFDIINSMFNDVKYQNVSKQEKKKNFFMINRRLSIGHPMQANVLNFIRINPEHASDVWHRFLLKQYGGKIPGWMYTKGEKKAKEAQEKKINISNKSITEFAKMNGFDIKSVRDAIKFFPKEAKVEIDASEQKE